MVLAALREAGADNETIVFFASDNGASNEGGHDYNFFNSSGPLNGFKRSLHEGGHRSPLVVRWPGHVAAGVKSQQQFAFYDFFSTALELAGLSPSAKLPANARDGDSLLPTLLGQPGTTQKEFIYHEYCAPNENKGGWGQALRMGDWSGVCVGEKPTKGWPVCSNDTFLLYDLSTDVGQKINVASSHPGIVATMLAKMTTERFNGGYCGEPAPPTPAPAPTPPIVVAELNGTWTQGKDQLVDIVIKTKEGGDLCISHEAECCKWDAGTGNVTGDGHTIIVDATGPSQFITSQRGTVLRSTDGKIDSISWTNVGGEKKTWADWTKAVPTLA